MDYQIRPAQPADVVCLPVIEREAAALFKDFETELGLKPEVVVASVDVFRAAQEAGRLIVAVDPGQRPVGFALIVEVDGCAHLDEMDVLPAHGRKGLGSALLEAVCNWARTSGFAAVTLSTFRDIPWNAPFYRRHGFRTIDSSALSQGLARLVEAESARGLRTDLRVMMRRETD